jgi:hypothetical protein
MRGFRQQIREADILLATDVRDPRNTRVVFHDRKPHRDDWHEIKTAEILTVQLDYETDDPQVLDELCTLLKGCPVLDR